MLVFNQSTITKLSVTERLIWCRGQVTPHLGLLGLETTTSTWEPTEDSHPRGTGYAPLTPRGAHPAGPGPRAHGEAEALGPQLLPTFTAPASRPTGKLPEGPGAGSERRGRPHPGRTPAPHPPAGRRLRSSPRSPSRWEVKIKKRVRKITFATEIGRIVTVSTFMKLSSWKEKCNFSYIMRT